MSKGEGKRSTKKCLAYVAAFVVFQMAIILVLALTVGKIKSPKIRFNAIAIESVFSSNNNSSSINMRLITQVTIKNTNFGHYRYDDSMLTILYDGVPLGEAVIPRGRAGARKTRRFNVSVDVRLNRVNELNSRVLRLSSRGNVKGKVHLMKVIKKNKSGEMNCEWNVNLDTRQVDNLKCN